MEVIIKSVGSASEIPLELLLLADPSKEQINRYIRNAQCLIAQVDEEIVGEAVIITKDTDTMEIINIAVREGFQGRGIGKKLLYSAIDLARNQGAKRIEIGTGNSSLKQLGIYQRCGFRMFEIWEDYFIKNYPEEIYEEGIQCRDMIRLKIDF
jgi:ribosomal protein S18 acetylase RimI-like enzyme